MDRKMLKRHFTRDSAPDWMCPTCCKGVLRIKKDSFFSDERSLSRDHDHPAWEPEYIEHVYTCLLYCTNDKCKEVVASTGVGSVDWGVQDDADGVPEQVYEDYFQPKYFEPPLKILNLPTKCPETILAPINESFRLVFASPSSAANCIRVAVEELLTDLNIRRFKNVNGARKYINLHQRISLIPEKYSEIRDLIFAIKWLGNAGSHSDGTISFDDVMDAYEFFEHIVLEVYDQKGKQLKAKAKKVNKKKGPEK